MEPNCWWGPRDREPGTSLENDFTAIMSLCFIHQAFPQVVKGDYWEIRMNVHYVTSESYPVSVEDVSPDEVTHQAEGVCL